MLDVFSIFYFFDLCVTYLAFGAAYIILPFSFFLSVIVTLPNLLKNMWSSQSLYFLLESSGIVATIQPLPIVWITIKVFFCTISF